MTESRFTTSAVLRDLDPVTFKQTVLARPDLFDRLNPDLVIDPVIGPIIGPIGPVIGPIGPITPRPDTTLPPVPADVRPGDLIQAGDWNQVLARLRRLDPVLTNVAEAAIALAARVATLEHQMATLPQPQQPPPVIDRGDIFTRFLGNADIQRAIAADPAIVKLINESDVVAGAVRNNPQVIENAIAGPAIIDPAPDRVGVLDPSVVVAGPAIGFAGGEAAPTLREQLIGAEVFNPMFVAHADIAERFGVASSELSPAVARAPAKAGVAKAGVAKAGVAKAGVAKAGVAKAGAAKAGAAKAGVAKAGGGG